MISENIYKSFGIDERVVELVKKSELKVKYRFESIDETAESNSRSTE